MLGQASFLLKPAIENGVEIVGKGRRLDKQKKRWQRGLRVGLLSRETTSDLFLN